MIKGILTFALLFLIILPTYSQSVLNSAKTERQIIFQNPSNSDGKIILSPNSNSDSSIILLLPYHLPVVNQSLNVKSINSNAVETTWDYPKPKYYVQTVSANNTIIGDSVSLILINGAYTMTLPSATGKAGQSLFLKKTYNTIGQYAATTQTGQTIDVSITTIMPTPSGTYGVIELVSDGANWWIVQYKNSTP